MYICRYQKQAKGYRAVNSEDAGLELMLVLILVRVLEDKRDRQERSKTW